jgi:hypothetical protein
MKLLLSTTVEIMGKVNEWSLSMLKLCEKLGLTYESEGVSNAFWMPTHEELDFEGKQFLWTSDFQKLVVIKCIFIEGFCIQIIYIGLLY